MWLLNAFHLSLILEWWCALVPLQGNQLEEEMRKDDKSCSQNGLERMCKLVAKDEGGPRLGDDDNEKDLPFPDERRGGLEE